MSGRRVTAIERQTRARMRACAMGARIARPKTNFYRGCFHIYNQRLPESVTILHRGPSALRPRPAT